MPYITERCRFSTRTNPTPNPGYRLRAEFARQATIAAFGRHAKALDQAGFIDRLPGEMPVPSPEARFK